MIDSDRQHPEFSIVMRGYDREQVDEYIRRLRELLALAEDRTRIAEDGAQPAEAGELRALRDEIAELTQTKAELITQLRRLRDVLGTTLRAV